MLNFKKMHGLGNDFVVVERDLPPETVKAMAERRYGVGCDQLLVMLPPVAPSADLLMKIYNPDGSEAGACGNGTRCVADLWMRAHERQSCTIETAAGLLACRRANDGLVEVNMGVPKLAWDEIPLAEEMDTLHLGIMRGAMHDPVAVNMGNPHAVFFVENVDQIALAELGPQIECHVMFPQRTNVEFAQILPGGKIRVRVWERGAGVTQACGSGACAVTVAAIRRGLLPERRAEIILDGGSLLISWEQDSGPVLMTGPVTHVFDGQWPD